MCPNETSKEASVKVERYFRDHIWCHESGPKDLRCRRQKNAAELPAPPSEVRQQSEDFQGKGCYIPLWPLEGGSVSVPVVSIPVSGGADLLFVRLEFFRSTLMTRACRPFRFFQQTEHSASQLKGRHLPRHIQKPKRRPQRGTQQYQ